MKLIADAGSSGTQWCLITDDSKLRFFECGPVNPVVHAPEEIAETIEAVIKYNIGSAKVDELWFYGAGCRPGKLSDIVADTFREIGSFGNIYVNSDMVGAARAACGHQPGIACILGTGSNSCLFDGERIIDSVPSMGYVLGDEGSGGYLGRILLNAVYKRGLPEHVIAKFNEFSGLTLDEVIEKVYRRTRPNTFLASFAPFLADNLSEPSVHDLVVGAFADFFERNVARYPHFKKYNVNFVGSIACSFKDQLLEAAGRFGCTVGCVIQSPLASLVNYHSR